MLGRGRRVGANVAEAHHPMSSPCPPGLGIRSQPVTDRNPKGSSHGLDPRGRRATGQRYHRSIVFYHDQVDFNLDHHTQNEHINVAQLTSPGSGCSIVFGDLPWQNRMEPGSLRALQLVVSDAAAALRTCSIVASRRVSSA